MVRQEKQRAKSNLPQEHSTMLTVRRLHGLRVRVISACAWDQIFIGTCEWNHISTSCASELRTYPQNVFISGGAEAIAPQVRRGLRLSSLRAYTIAYMQG